MAVKIGGKVIRNIPEQVRKNKHDIKANIVDIQSLASYIETVEQKLNDIASGVYKAQGDATIAELNALTVDSSMNGYVYNVTDSGTLTHGDLLVNAGDNVVIVYDDSTDTFVWDKLSGIIDLTSYYTKTESDAKFVDLSSAQTITGVKTFNTIYSPDISGSPSKNNGFDLATTNYTSVKSSFRPGTTAVYDLGTSYFKWKDIYLSNAINLGTSGIMKYDNTISAFTTNSHIAPAITNSYDLGTSYYKWKDAYISGNLTDGTNSVTIASLAAAIGGTTQLYLHTMNIEGAWSTQDYEYFFMDLKFISTKSTGYTRAEFESFANVFAFLNYLSNEGSIRLTEMIYFEDDDTDDSGVLNPIFHYEGNYLYMTGKQAVNAGQPLQDFNHVSIEPQEAQGFDLDGITDTVAAI